MQNFAKRAKSGDAQNGQPSGLNRAAIAANAKAPIQRTILNHQDHVQQHFPARRQNGGQANPPVVQQQPQQPQQWHQGPGHGTQQKADVYDTDTESLDTTAHQRSVMQVEDGQQHGQQYVQELVGDDEYDEDGSDDEDEEGDDEEGGGDGEFEGTDSQEQAYEEHEQQLLRRAGIAHAPPNVQQAFLETYEPQRGVFDGDESYPTTASGPPSNFPQDQEQTPDDCDQQIVSPSPQRPVMKGQPVQRPPAALETTHTMYSQPQVFQKAAALRVNQRTDSNVPVRGGALQQSHRTPPPNTQPTIYSQSTPPNLSNGNTHQNVRMRANHAPRRGPQQPSAPTHPGSVKPVQQPAPAKRAIPSQLVEEVHIHEQPVKEVHAHLQAPVEDYDRPALLKMDYEQLKNEDFDTIPRATNPVLSQDMLQKPLIDRLTHVRKSLNSEDQGKFFSSLPTDEWEEAGDWFLGQFSSIIERTKNARQEKRKLAKDFEAEVEQRHRKVAKKQREVEHAMSKMKAHGQNLMPKSPMRGSKSPMREK
ncbi:hypothetical protein K505DRAFT_323124 [Melanomma pulvis-pyrius CBS 109.77]|uniref:Extracellular mutant protein 11 C-terminal domain-containing protein n=1 Tax=Melanomma pulvis-pyrius CBS 109.77 TaxID=1314802 RepID=A0A6A6XL97_9PLEO|nr:hypothetical protein K505DRAFT_323124 [Melanomma pulvis-pyrius CBS 109.77]